ncbi:MAG: DUF3524 domain-containing protein [Planctomycetota bacterium]|nr:DUF3524 domain-containing protein [Planctomycetota bacterium]
MEPYFGGSHRAFLENLRDLSAHDWELQTGEPRFWKWRMRSFPLSLAERQRKWWRTANPDDMPLPDAIFATSMLDLPCYLGHLSQSLADPQATQTEKRYCEHLLNIPIALYFHENQLTYPISPKSTPDFHYGYSNLCSALLATEVWFNSDYHRKAFINASIQFVAKMPDNHGIHQLEKLENKSRVLPPGFRWVGTPEYARAKAELQIPDSMAGEPLRIGWVARWEYDKRPDRFVELLAKLDRDGYAFQLILLGPRSDDVSELKIIEERYADKILFNAKAESTEDYRSWLQQMDYVISTADHEFFGIGVCEAISAGAIPVLPKDQSYPELVPAECLYKNDDEAIEIIRNNINLKERRSTKIACQEHLKKFESQRCVERIDLAASRIIDQCKSR